MRSEYVERHIRQVEDKAARYASRAGLPPDLCFVCLLAVMERYLDKQLHGADTTVVGDGSAETVVPEVERSFVAYLPQVAVPPYHTVFEVSTPVQPKPRTFASIGFARAAALVASLALVVSMALNWYQASGSASSPEGRFVLAPVSPKDNTRPDLEIDLDGQIGSDSGVIVIGDFTSDEDVPDVNGEYEPNHN